MIIAVCGHIVHSKSPPQIYSLPQLNLRKIFQYYLHY